MCFLRDPGGRNTFADLYYESENNRFSGIAATLDSDNYIYAQDHHHNRIIKIILERSQYIKLSNGELVLDTFGYFWPDCNSRGHGCWYRKRPTGYGC